MDFDNNEQFFGILDDINNLFQQDIDFPDTVHDHAEVIQLPTIHQDEPVKDDISTTEVRRIESLLDEKERVLWINRSMQIHIQEQLDKIQFLLGKKKPSNETASSPLETTGNEEDASSRSTSFHLLRSFPETGSSYYFSRKSKSYPRFLSKENKLLSFQKTKQPSNVKSWNEKSDQLLKDLVMEECNQLILLGSVPDEQKGNVAAYRSVTNQLDKTHYLYLLMPHLINCFSWENIASKVGHSQTDCFVHWMNACDPFINVSAWSKEEDQRLYEASNISNGRQWVKIATAVGNGRVPIQCFLHFIRDMEMKGYYQKWSIKEDEKIMDSVQRLGTKSWKEVAKNLPNRTWEQCRSRYYQSLRYQGRKGRWSELEKCRLVLNLFFYGQENWSFIAKKMVTRNSVQCRDAWSRNLDPEISHAQWLSREDHLLVTLGDTSEIKAWTEICKKFPGRTSDACKTRYAFIKRKKSSVCYNHHVVIILVEILLLRELV